MKNKKNIKFVCQLPADGQQTTVGVTYVLKSMRSKTRNHQSNKKHQTNKPADKGQKHSLVLINEMGGVSYGFTFYIFSLS